MNHPGEYYALFQCFIKPGCIPLHYELFKSQITAVIKRGTKQSASRAVEVHAKHALSRLEKWIKPFMHRSAPDCIRPRFPLCVNDQIIIPRISLTRDNNNNGTPSMMSCVSIYKLK